MKIEEKINKRIQELIDLGIKVKATRRSGGGTSLADLYFDFVDTELAHQWGISSLHLLKKIFGEDSDHYKRFNELFSEFSNSRKNYSKVNNAFGILNAAKDDFENDFLSKTRTLIEAEVFDEFLEQAEELFKKDYYQPAAIIAGCVLEDGLRKLCDRNSIALSAKATIDPMNVELAKAGIYTKLVQKKITALADLRNKAAHGEWSEFTDKDVEDMIRNVRRFMEDYFN